MTNDGKPVYCWDASVFLAWINDEAAAPLADIAQVVEEIDKNASLRRSSINATRSIPSTTVAAGRSS